MNAMVSSTHLKRLMTNLRAAAGREIASCLGEVAGRLPSAA